MKTIDVSKCYIITGEYESAEKEQKEIVEKIFSNEDVSYKFKLYFHWYNVVHELGHVLLMFEDDKNMTQIEEECLVNDFAVAFLAEYGEKVKFNYLNDLVNSCLNNFTCPNPSKDFFTYASDALNTPEELFTFNNYGWFQFSSVADSLKKQRSLNDVLKQMLKIDISDVVRKTLYYDISEENLAVNVIKGAIEIFNTWGIKMSMIEHRYVSDPNAHGVQCK